MSDKTLEKIIKRILNKITAEKIILFGSRSRDDFHEDSDYDLLVICDDNVDVKKISKEIYSQFTDINKGVDVIIRPNKYIKKSLKHVNSFISSIYNEGKVIYG
ncbi:MAG TPA: nucleotidyltransferase domain-containing protein [Candidatus Gastranaerophilaceae bacterium]|nr:nucleotidyltransferase domain-containing protein [Candidatus Gastranaerophilaceae bacterium]HPT41624.1 nucleotidyltransferase domain-containing protein [Candidatus Gastranaerophilaceae bacterium]